MNICTNDMMGLYEIFYIVLTIFKILIPLIIIGYGTFDFYQAVIKNEEGLIKKKFSRFIKRIISGILIFFVPSFVLFMFESTEFDRNQFSCVYKCVLDGECASTGGGTSGSGASGSGSTFCTVESGTCVDDSIYYSG